MIARHATGRILLAVLACLLVALAVPAAASAAEFTVDSHVDERDENLGDGTCDATVFDGTCTLRAAIEEIDYQEASENTIKFDPTAFDDEVPIFVSSLLGALPPIEFPTTIEAGSECEYAGVDGAPCVGVVGLEGEPVFVVEADNTKISGMAITGGSVGIGVYDDSTGFEATGNWIGIGLNGSNALPAAADGVLLGPGSDDATIGGSGTGERNVIAFNDVGLEIQGASHTTVRGNYFGVTGDGETPGPQEVDIRIANAEPTSGNEVKAEDNEIGAALDESSRQSAECDGGCNVISGAQEGIVLYRSNPLDLPASGPTTIHGNYIGLDATGDRAVKVDEGPSDRFEGNRSAGISAGSAKDVTVGGDPTSEANYVVGGNTGIDSEDGDGFEALGNRFGYSASGAEAAPPSAQAIFLFMAGTNDPPVIDGNRIQEGETEATGIRHSRIGATITGNTITGGEVGISSETTPATGRGSLIEGNTVEGTQGAGIIVTNADNEIVGNKVLGAADGGIEVESASDEDDGNVIGGDEPELENVISDGGGFAIVVHGVDGARNEIRANHGSGNEGELGFIVLPDDGLTEPPNGVDEPTVKAASTSKAEGIAEPHAIVRVFYKASAEPGELGGYLGKVEADESGNWHLTYSASVPAEELITATQTLDGGTSTLAEPVNAHSENPPPPVCPEVGATGCETMPPPSSNTSPPPPGPTPATTKPKVTIKKAPKAKSKSTTAKFVFNSSELGSKFQCKLDKGRFANCRSPKTYKKLKPGKHVFKVKATDKAGKVSAVVTRKFTVLAS